MASVVLKRVYFTIVVLVMIMFGGIAILALFGILTVMLINILPVQ